jgi:hypothetical protein
LQLVVFGFATVDDVAQEYDFALCKSCAKKLSGIEGRSVLERVHAESKHAVDELAVCFAEQVVSLARTQ